RALELLNDRHCHLPAIRCFPNGFEGAAVRFVGAMRKVQSSRIHAALDQSVQHSRRVTGRTNRADDLGFSHLKTFIRRSYLVSRRSYLAGVCLRTTLHASRSTTLTLHERRDTRDAFLGCRTHSTKRSAVRQRDNGCP